VSNEHFIFGRVSEGVTSDNGEFRITPGSLCELMKINRNTLTAPTVPNMLAAKLSDLGYTFSTTRQNDFNALQAMAVIKYFAIQAGDAKKLSAYHLYKALTTPYGS